MPLTILNSPVATEMAKAGTRPNGGDFNGMPNWAHRAAAARDRAAQAGAEANRAKSVPITLKPFPWEQETT